MKILGPRFIDYEAANGDKGVVKINLEIGSTSEVVLGGGEVDQEIEGKVNISSPIFSRTINFPAADELQLIMRLLWLSDVYIREVCKENNIRLFPWRDYDVNSEYSVYKL